MGLSALVGIQHRCPPEEPAGNQSFSAEGLPISKPSVSFFLLRSQPQSHGTLPSGVDATQVPVP